MASEWITDDLDIQTWTYEGWRIVKWPFGGFECYSPDGDDRDISYDEEEKTLCITHDADWPGSVSVTVPVAVVIELLRMSQEHTVGKDHVHNS